LAHGAVQSILQGEGEGLSIGDIIRQLYHDVEIKMISELLRKNLLPRCIDRDTELFNGNTIPISMRAVAEEAKGISKRVLLGYSNYFTSHFVNKHTAPTKEEASKNAKVYGGTVSVIKITDAYLPTLLDSVKKKNLQIFPTTVWVFNNCSFKEIKSEVRIYFDI
jgi:hypothetical protein